MRGTRRCAGLTLVESVVAAFLFAVLLLAALALWDSATRIHKSEIEIADAQRSVRYGLHQMARVVRSAGAGGLSVAQAVLVRPDPGLPGVSASPDGDYDNVVGGKITDLAGKDVPGMSLYAASELDIYPSFLLGRIPLTRTYQEQNRPTEL